MAQELVPRQPFWDFGRFSSIFDNDEDWGRLSPRTKNLNVSEDEKNVFVEAPVPGIDPAKIDVTFDQGTLWIQASQEEKEEDVKRKFYRRSERSYSYRLAVPGSVDETKDPDVNYANGMLTVTFTKKPRAEVKKLAVKRK